MPVVLLVNVIAVLAMPPALVFLFMLVNDREIMGDLDQPAVGERAGDDCGDYSDRRGRVVWREYSCAAAFWIFSGT